MATSCLRLSFKRHPLAFLKILDSNALVGKCIAAIFSVIVDQPNSSRLPSCLAKRGPARLSYKQPLGYKKCRQVSFVCVLFKLFFNKKVGDRLVKLFLTFMLFLKLFSRFNKL